MTCWSLLCIWACWLPLNAPHILFSTHHRHQCRQQTHEISSDFMSHYLAKHPISGRMILSHASMWSHFFAQIRGPGRQFHGCGASKNTWNGEKWHEVHLPLHAALMLWGWNSKALDITEWITAPHALACRNSPGWLDQLFGLCLNKLLGVLHGDDSGVGGDKW